MPSEYAPERGDIVWLQFNPQAGHEQAGRRPALTLTPGIYNSKRGLAMFCPITSKLKPYLLAVELPSELEVSGYVLVDQLKSLDWRQRAAEFACRAPEECLQEVLLRLEALLWPEGRI